MELSDKFCPCCMQRKPIDGFYKNKSSKWKNIRAYCKDCELEKGRLYKKENQPRIKKLKHLWDLRNKDGKKREHEIKYRMKHPFKGRSKISVKFFRALYLSHPYCTYCLVALNADEASLDHKTPVSRGGGREDPDNLAITCRDCNYLKHTRTHDEFLKFLPNYIKRFRDNTEPSRLSAEGVTVSPAITDINAPTQ